MSYKVIHNGLWSEEKRSGVQIVYDTGGMDFITSSGNSLGNYQSITVSEMEDAITQVFNEEGESRDILIHTGPEGHRQFQEAIQEAVNTTDVTFGGSITVTNIDPVMERVNPIRNIPALDPMIGFSQISHIPNNTYLEIQTALLQAGTIDMMTFLDNISEHEEQQNT